MYKKPFTLPKGTRLDVTLTYDNSADNPRNPINPPRRRSWGEQSFDEMGTVGFDVRGAEQGGCRPPSSRRSPHERRAAIAAGGQERHARAVCWRDSGEPRTCSSSPSSIGKGTS